MRRLRYITHTVGVQHQCSAMPAGINLPGLAPGCWHHLVSEGCWLVSDLYAVSPFDAIQQCLFQLALQAAGRSSSILRKFLAPQCTACGLDIHSCIQEGRPRVSKDEEEGQPPYHMSYIDTCMQLRSHASKLCTHACRIAGRAFLVHAFAQLSGTVYMTALCLAGMH